MKCCKILLILTFATLPLLAEISIERMDKMVEEIKAKRKSKIVDRTNIKSPFVILKTDTNSSTKESVPVKEEKAAFSLGAIMNSSAFIDSKWYKAGDKVGDFVIDDIKSDHVVLKKEKRTITLFFHKPDKIIDIKDK